MGGNLHFTADTNFQNCSLALNLAVVIGVISGALKRRQSSNKKFNLSYPTSKISSNNDETHRLVAERAKGK